MINSGDDADPVITVSIDADSSTAPFDQVRSQLATMISDGRLEAGARLPTVRRLAEDLGLAVNTVARAYRELETDGVITTQGRRGTFVTARATDTEDVTTAAAQYVASARQSGLTLSERSAPSKTPGDLDTRLLILAKGPWSMSLRVTKARATGRGDRPVRRRGRRLHPAG
jgi:DNA-binding transcriptional regulator YhcF (GntR family)